MYSVLISVEINNAHEIIPRSQKQHFVNNAEKKLSELAEIKNIVLISVEINLNTRMVGIKNITSTYKTKVLDLAV